MLRLLGSLLSAWWWCGGGVLLCSGLQQMTMMWSLEQRRPQNQPRCLHLAPVPALRGGWMRGIIHAACFSSSIIPWDFLIFSTNCEDWGGIRVLSVTQLLTCSG